MRAAGAVAAIAAVTTGGAALDGPTEHPQPVGAASVAFGVYGGPASKGVQDAAQFDAEMGTRSTQSLDFPPADDWAQIEGQPWLLGVHADQHQRLEYSLPLVPDLPGTSLTACAQGAYDAHWAALGRNLVVAGLADTVVRPGWEFNGDWYRWQAASDPAGFAACFRRVVTTMREVDGQQFGFDWSVAVGPSHMDATPAWPGAQFVDYVGVDVYDTSWTNYHPGREPTRTEQAATVHELIEGRFGLAWWGRFADAHGVQLAVPEWGVTWRADGHGGGDDPLFIDAMFGYFRTHRVAYTHYFDFGVASLDHRLTGATRFPRSAQRFRTLAAAAS